MNRFIEPRVAINLICCSQLKGDERELFKVNYPMFPDKRNAIFVKGSHLVYHSVFWDIFDKQWCINQSEYPLSSLGWIIDTLVNEMWAPSSPIDLTAESLSFKDIFEGEEIGISPMLHCCAENLFGYNIWNASRRSHLSDSPPQNWHIPRYMLQDEGVIEKLKQINADYLAGKFDDLAR